jgi:hypothetical protein
MWWCPGRAVRSAWLASQSDRTVAVTAGGGSDDSPDVPWRASDASDPDGNATGPLADGSADVPRSEGSGPSPVWGMGGAEEAAAAVPLAGSWAVACEVCSVASGAVCEVSVRAPEGSSDRGEPEAPFLDPSGDGGGVPSEATDGLGAAFFIVLPT